MAPMSVLGTVIVGVVILLGVIGAVVQVWPSAPLVGGAILVWAWLTGTSSAWIVFAIAALVLILGTVLKYVIPARGMNKAGIPQSTLVWGALGGVVGWFIGLPLGLVLGMIATTFASNTCAAATPQPPGCPPSRPSRPSAGRLPSS